MKVLIEIRGGVIVRVATDSIHEDPQVFIQDWDVSEHLEPEETNVEELSYSEELLLDEL
jgi:hypothetical protein